MTTTVMTVLALLLGSSALIVVQGIARDGRPSKGPRSRKIVAAITDTTPKEEVGIVDAVLVAGLVPPAEGLEGRPAGAALRSRTAARRR